MLKQKSILGSWKAPHRILQPHRYCRYYRWYYKDCGAAAYTQHTLAFNFVSKAFGKHANIRRNYSYLLPRIRAERKMFRRSGKSVFVCNCIFTINMLWLILHQMSHTRTCIYIFFESLMKWFQNSSFPEFIKFMLHFKRIHDISSGASLISKYITNLKAPVESC